MHWGKVLLDKCWGWGNSVCGLSLTNVTKWWAPGCIIVKSKILKTLKLCLLFKSSLIPEKKITKGKIFFKIKFTWMTNVHIVKWHFTTIVTSELKLQNYNLTPIILKKMCKLELLSDYRKAKIYSMRKTQIKWK